MLSVAKKRLNMWPEHANTSDIDLVHSRHFNLSLKKKHRCKGSPYD